MDQRPAAGSAVHTVFLAPVCDVDPLAFEGRVSFEREVTEGVRQ